MQNFTEDHTSKNLANILDKLIRMIPGLDLSKTKLTSVNDNAANIVRGIRLSDTITGQVRCVAHTLQLVLNDCINSEPQVADIIRKCKAIASLTHRSSKQANKVKMMCERLNNDPSQTQQWNYRVIVSPGGIRWNSTFFCMKSIQKLEEPLLQLRGSDSDFHEVPTELEFTMIEDILPILDAFNKATDEVSAEITITMQDVLRLIYNLTKYLENSTTTYQSVHQPVRHWVRNALANMRDRFPNYGTEVREFAIGHFFNPEFRGLICKITDRDSWDNLLEEFINANAKVNKISSVNSE